MLCMAATGSIHAAMPQLGIKGGLGFSDISGASIPTNGRIGIQVGGVAIQKISNTINLQFEALYIQKGTHLSHTSGGHTYEFEYNLDYFEIPILATLKITDIWGIYAGGYGSLALNKKLKISEGGSSTETNISNQDSESFSADTLDYGVLIGAQAQLTNNWMLDLRYDFGLKDTFKNNGTSTESDHRTLSLTAAYLF